MILRLLCSLLIPLLVVLTAVPSWAEHPVIATTNTVTDTDGDLTPQNMPASISAGDLLLILCGHVSGSTILSESGGSAWTRIVGAVGGALSISVHAKIAAGGDTLTTDGFANGDTACGALRITGHGVSNVATQIYISTLASATNTGPDPLTVLGSGAQDYLALEFLVTTNNTSITNYSTNYTEVTNVSSGAANAVRAAVGQRNATTTNENADAMLQAASVAYHVIGLMVPPAGGAAVTPRGMLLGVYP